MAEKECLISKANLDDLDSVLYLYSNYMFDSFLLKLGSGLVRRYLKIIISSKHCITLIAKTQTENLVGFIMATFDSRKLMFELIFDSELLWIALKCFLFTPALVFRNIGSFLYPIRTRIKDVNAEFLFIAIQPEYRKLNFGTRLIKEAIDFMREKGVRKAKVSTQSTNEPVNLLLIRLGFEFEKAFVLLKKRMYLYRYILQ